MDSFNAHNMDQDTIENVGTPLEDETLQNHDLFDHWTTFPSM